MGCDIHVTLQHRNKNNQWEDADFYRPLGNDQFERVQVYIWRNYPFFGLLAGVRSYIEPIDYPRGIPHDAPDWYKKEYSTENYYHSHTYYTLNELIDYLNKQETNPTVLKPIMDENGRILRVGDQVLYTQLQPEEDEDEDFDQAILALKELVQRCKWRLEDIEYFNENPSNLRLLICFDS